MEKKLIIDYKNKAGNFERKVIDDFELSVRKGMAYFKSDGERNVVPLENISQIYTY